MSGGGPRGRSADHASEGSRQGLVRALAAMLPWNLVQEIRDGQARLDRAENRLDPIEKRIDGVEARLDAFGEANSALAGRQDLVESTLRTLQELLESINSVRLLAVDQRVDRVEAELAQTTDEVGRLRDAVMPAAEGRWDVLFERLAFELEETASLVERMLVSEPLPVPKSDQSERDLADGLAKIQPLLVEAFRGSEAEIGFRLGNTLPLFEGHEPVVDLGCGRGELLLLLREAGVEARGIESDDALVQGAIRRGLNVDHADVLDALRALDEGSVGAFTAFHLFEHFSGALLPAVLDQCRRVLRPGGILVAECPNPHNLRVGASLFWQDPTHVRPLLPETLSLFLKASGFKVDHLEYLHPFPEEQCFRLGEDSKVDSVIGGRIDRLEARLDELLHGPRDFRLVAVKQPHLKK
ncbi:MAG: hypothetical protein DRJ65_12170 [Acidobacteria bacterium]|nr:MAG: hypothetical protein DRJ65_12170 [Acidobacteriota bacterium]